MSGFAIRAALGHFICGAARELKPSTRIRSSGQIPSFSSVNLSGHGEVWWVCSRVDSRIRGARVLELRCLTEVDDSDSEMEKRKGTFCDAKIGQREEKRERKSGKQAGGKDSGWVVKARQEAKATEKTKDEEAEAVDGETGRLTGRERESLAERDTTRQY